MLSYWERKEMDRKFDLLVVGGGITGYSAAIDFKSYRPDLRVGLVELSSFETAASTKNAGFACFGSVTEMMSDARRLGEEGLMELVRKRWNGLRMLRQRVGDQAMDYNECGGYELFLDEESWHKAQKAIAQLNSSLHTIVGTDVFQKLEGAAHFRFEGAKGMVMNRYEGQLNPAKMMGGLRSSARSLGIESYHASIEAIEERADDVRLSMAEGELRADQVVVAVNGMASKLLDLDVRPARAQVLITEPIDELGWTGTFHMDEGYYYFRNVGERVLIGGGRNLDLKGEETLSHDTTDLIQDALESMLHNHILPDRDFKVSARWAGTMGVGSEKTPIVQKVSDRVIAAVRLGGMGVAIGSLVGREAAELAL